MARLFEIEDVSTVPARLAMSAGDWLLIHATGVRVVRPQLGELPVAIHGPFVRGVVGPAGEMLAPAGPPGVVFCEAQHPGVSEIELITGDPWRRADSRILQLLIE